MSPDLRHFACRLAGRIYQDAEWYLRYRCNPSNRHPTALRFEPDVAGVRPALAKAGIAVESFSISRDRFSDFLHSCSYPQDYHDGRGQTFTEKSLEHFISLELLHFQREDIYIDIASDRSPFPDLVRKTFGCQVYANDLSYPPDISDGWRIGSDATRLPLPDGSVSKATLHCSFEHFEEDSDSRLMDELARVLKPGGKACIVPLYLHTEYVAVTDPQVDRRGLQWEAEINPILLKGYGQRQGRFYDVPHLQQKILSRLSTLAARLFEVENLDDIGHGLWCHWVLMLEKP